MGEPEAILLQCGGAPLRIPAASGRAYRILVPNAAACGRLVNDALRATRAELVPRTGGLLAGLTVLENILLPAVFHRRFEDVRAGESAEAHLYGAFAACGLERAQSEALCARGVPELGAFERRLVALVRAMLMRPALLVLERLSEGLTARDMARVAGFVASYRLAVPGGTLVSVDIAGMPCADAAFDVQAEADQP